MTASPPSAREFAILRRLSAEQVRRIDPETAAAGTWRDCPLNQATGMRSTLGVASLLTPRAFGDEFREALEDCCAFADWWDSQTGSPRAEMRAQLAAAIAAVLAERGEAAS